MLAVVPLTLRQLNRATLARQHLLARSRLSVVDAIEHLVGLQAQLARPPFVGLWSRLEDLPRERVITELLEKRVVRATAFRATLHLMSATDFVRLRETLQPGLDRALKVLRGRAADLDAAALDVQGRAFFKEPATFDQLRVHLASRISGADVRAMAYAIRLRTPLVQVPVRDSVWGFPGQASFVSAERWLPKLPRQKLSAGELVLRYLAAYGPATIADMQAWSGLPNLKAAFDAVRPRLVAFGADKRAELFDLPDAPRPDEDTPAPVRFLPEYDNLIIGRADARVLAARHRPAVFLPGLRVLPTVLVDGFAAGTWKVDRKKASATLTVDAFARPAARVREEIEAEGERLLHFVEPDAATRLVKIS